MYYKIKRTSIFILFLFFIQHVESQSVGINTNPDPSAALDITSTSKGMLVPRLKKVWRENIQNPANGLLVYELESKSFWYYNNDVWVDIGQGKVFENVNGLVRNTGYNSMDDFVFGSDALPIDGIDHSDSLFFFDKSKAAFRAGRLANSDRWNPTNIGFGSIAFGYNNKASGVYSTALGLDSEAEGNYAMVAGTLNKATGVASTALGFFTEANGYSSLSAGFGTKSNAQYNTAIGHYNMGTGNENQWIPTDPIFEVGIGTGDNDRNNGLTLLKNGSLIIGGDHIPQANEIVDTTILYFDRINGAFRAGGTENNPYWSSDFVGDYSFAAGKSTQAIGTYSSAFGLGSIASGDYGVAMGYGTEASDSRASAFGNFTNATNYSAFASGDQSTASGFASTAMGYKTNATKDYAFAVGQLTNATGAASTALGSQNLASATASTALGIQTIAKGAYSLSAGLQTDADSYAGAAFGRYNIGGGSGTSWNINDPLFEIGIGSSASNRENALTINKSGKVTFLNYDLPLNDGAANQILKTNGSGKLAWSEDRNDAIFRTASSVIGPLGQYENKDFMIGRNSIPYTAIKDTFMVFYENNGAFRAGILQSSDAWIPINVGKASFASGTNTIAEGDYSAAFGNSGNAEGYASFVTGFKNNALGTYAIATGDKTTASAANSTTFGEGSQASGINSFATGAYGNASGKNAFKAGFANFASNENSFAIGNATSASGFASLSGGLTTMATASYAVALGVSTRAESYACLAIGRYNEGLAGSPTSWFQDDAVFEVGIGTNTDRKNAMTVLKDGKVGIGTSSPGSTLEVYSDTQTGAVLNASGPNGSIFTAFPNKQMHFSGDVNVHGKLDLWPSNVGLGYRLELPNIATIEDGTAVAYNWHTYSDQRVKTNIEDLEYGLKDVMELRPVKYRHHSSDVENGQVVIKELEYNEDFGFLAQDVHKIIKEIVNKPVNNESALWTLNYQKLTPILVSAIQEQQSTIEDLNSRLLEMEVKMEKLLSEK